MCGVAKKEYTTAYRATQFINGLHNSSSDYAVDNLKYRVTLVPSGAGVVYHIYSLINGFNIGFRHFIFFHPGSYRRGLLWSVMCTRMTTNGDYHGLIRLRSHYLSCSIRQNRHSNLKTYKYIHIRVCTQWF